MAHVKTHKRRVKVRTKRAGEIPGKSFKDVIVKGHRRR